jgi:hypothetical protein
MTAGNDTSHLRTADPFRSRPVWIGVAVQLARSRAGTISEQRDRRGKFGEKRRIHVSFGMEGWIFPLASQEWEISA